MSERTSDDAAHLARVVVGWRSRHGWSQAVVSARGGPSATTLSAIESAEWSSERPAATLAKLDAGLGWPRGTAAKVLHEGFEPFDELVQPAVPGSTGPVDVPVLDKQAARRQVTALVQEVYFHEAAVHDAQAQLARSRAALDLARASLEDLAASAGQGSSA
ncbi:MAG: hypothetical protein JWN84_3114 [Nocardioides sp.]|nr:hypothetical protein [Nocardioides sp.]